jgi:diguanylate cyclase
MPNQASLRRSRPGAQRAPGEPAATHDELGDYGSRINALAERIRATDDLSTIIGMLNQALIETRRLRSKDDELAAAQRKVEEAERNIEAMKDELEQVKAMLHQDPLTGTLNRRGIDDAFRREASRCDRQGSRLCVAMIDLDNFKSINDTLGHQSGDNALVHVTRVVRSSLRPTDRIGRFGGEEFLILLPDTALKECTSVFARIKRELAAQPLPEKERNLKITFSGGVAERAEREPLETLLARVDAALFQAKRAGKNRITLSR